MNEDYEYYWIYISDIASSQNLLIVFSISFIAMTLRR